MNVVSFLVLFFLFCKRKNAQPQSCYGYSQDFCLDCAFDSYKDNVGVFGRFPIASCKKRVNLPYNKIIFVSSSKCLRNSACNGSESSPYDNLIIAFRNEGLLANKFLNSSLDFKLLGSQHYILRKDMSSDGREQLFRRIFTNITIRPHYCSEKLITGCFQKDEKPSIVVKTDTFYFFIAYRLKLLNLSFNGIDLHTHTSITLNTTTGCHNLESICCNISLTRMTFTSSRPCALQNRVLTLGVESF